MKNYKESGEVLDYTNATGDTIPSGAVVIVGNLVGIAVTDILDGESGAVNLCGAYELTKDTPLAIAQGDEVFWSVADSEVTKTATDKPLGTAFVAAGSADTTVIVKLYGQGNGVPVAAVVAALTDNSGGAANSTIAVIAAGTPADLAAQGVINAVIADNFADAAAKINAILTSLKNAGIMASA
jgi:predicted RecA/RadA family phage recombinase